MRFLSGSIKHAKYPTGIPPGAPVLRHETSISCLQRTNGMEQLEAFAKAYEEIRIIGSEARETKQDEVYFYPGLSDDGTISNPRVRRVVNDAIKDGATRAFHVTDVDRVQEQAQYWFRTFPDVEPHYAVKSNNSALILRTLVQQGFGFDCASTEEISDVLSAGGTADDIVLSNACKTEYDLLAAKAAGVRLTVFDSISELEKIHRLYPAVELMVRIYASSSGCYIDLSGKAGAPKQDWPELLQACKDMGLKLRGAMFHIGSGHDQDNSGAYDRALGDAAQLFDMARGYGYKLDTVDMGGGMTQAYGTETAQVLDRARSDFPSHTRWIGEPGRLICSAAQTVAARVIGRKSSSVTIDDGVHGSFSCILQEKDHQLAAAFPVNENDAMLPGLPLPRGYRDMRIYGPTCDGLDVVCESIPVSEDVKVGDWLVFNGMGAYTQVTSSRFNGIYKSTEILCGDEPTISNAAPNLIRGSQLPGRGLPRRPYNSFGVGT